jgi:hypothetical protein
MTITASLSFDVTNTTSKEKKRFIDAVCYQADRFIDALDCIRMTSYGSQLLKSMEREERNHRRNNDGYSLSIRKTAKVQLVKVIYESLLGHHDDWELKDLFTYRRSLLEAHALVLNYETELRKVLRFETFDTLAALDPNKGYIYDTLWDYCVYACKH